MFWAKTKIQKIESSIKKKNKSDAEKWLDEYQRCAEGFYDEYDRRYQVRLATLFALSKKTRDMINHVEREEWDHLKNAHTELKNHFQNIEREAQENGLSLTQIGQMRIELAR